jgi:RimJ/RimL family protein N-acetyltransferase
MQYRELQIEDFSAYNKLREMALDTEPEAFKSTNNEERKNREEKFNLNIQNKFNFILGAFKANDLVGVATFIREIRKKTIHKGGIYGVFVDPDYRGRGIGTKLLDLVIDKSFKIDGIKQINLSVTFSNKKASRLYEKAGFVPYGLEKAAFCVNDVFYDNLLMVRFK